MPCIRSDREAEARQPRPRQRKRGDRENQMVDRADWWSPGETALKSGRLGRTRSLPPSLSLFTRQVKVPLVRSGRSGALEE
jgi:hypothetical protein